MLADHNAPQTQKDTVAVWAENEKENQIKAMSFEHWKKNKADDVNFNPQNSVVIIDPSDEWKAHVEELISMSAIGIRFKSFTDGRGYSIAYQLSRRYGFEGELRAMGDIFKDVSPNLIRCGFSTYQLSCGQSGALASFYSQAPFRDQYQLSSDRRTTIKQKRHAL